jgi:hypothetical protein
MDDFERRLDSPIIRGFTSREISDVQKVLRFLDAVRRLTGVSELRSGVFVDDSGGETMGDVISSLSEEEIAGRLDEDAFSFCVSRAIVGGYLSNKERSSPGRDVDVRQSEIEVALFEQEWREDVDTCDAVWRVCVDAAESFRCNLLFVGHRGAFEMRYSTRRQIGVGLLDMYWITILGEPFLRVMDRSKLQDLPVYRLQWISGSMVALQSHSTFAASVTASGKADREKLKNAIGRDYFAEPPRALSSFGEVGVWSIGKLLSMWRREQDSYSDLSGIAKIPPRF